MRLPRLVILLGYAGLIPFLLGPLWLTVAREAPAWVMDAWVAYITLIAAFLAGTFWGFALPAVQGPAGQLGAVLAAGLLLLTWATILVPSRFQLPALALVFLLQLLADFWRERTLDTLPGYFMLRTVLTIGAVVAIAWWILLDALQAAP